MDVALHSDPLRAELLALAIAQARERTGQPLPPGPWRPRTRGPSMLSIIEPGTDVAALRGALRVAAEVSGEVLGELRQAGSVHDLLREAEGALGAIAEDPRDPVRVAIVQGVGRALHPLGRRAFTVRDTPAAYITIWSRGLLARVRQQRDRVAERSRVHAVLYFVRAFAGVPALLQGEESSARLLVVRLSRALCAARIADILDQSRVLEALVTAAVTEGTQRALLPAGLDGCIRGSLRELTESMEAHLKEALRPDLLITVARRFHPQAGGRVIARA